MYFPLSNVFYILFCLITRIHGDAQTILSPSADCHNACLTLVNLLRNDKVLYQDLTPEAFTTYFSNQQREVIPACLILPTTAQEVSTTIKVITQFQCRFGVKSGGHAMFAGASNTFGGITIDLRNLNSLQISLDRKVASLGPGNRWEDVFGWLDGYNVTVVGGRNAGVGVGGFLLGGGISFISRMYGWGLDNVRNYELVLANGSISNINMDTNPDLFWALRGGGKSFGIVTRFDVSTYPDTEMWGGVNIMLLDSIPQLLSSLGISRKFSWTRVSVIEKTMGVLTNVICKLGYCIKINDIAEMLGEIVQEAEKDIYAHAWAVLIFVGSAQTYLFSAEMNHGKGLAGAPGFGTMHRARKVYSTNRIGRISDFAREVKALDSSRGRILYETATFRFDVSFQEEIVKIYVSEIEKVRHIPNLMSCIPLQIITKAEIAQFQKNGGNALGIDPADGPLLLIHTVFVWQDEKDDATFHHASKNILDRAIAVAKARGLHHPFIYQNYAGKRQDVFASYGEKNLARLRRIRDQYDPEHVFTKLSPGYFNL